MAQKAGKREAAYLEGGLIPWSMDLVLESLQPDEPHGAHLHSFHLATASKKKNDGEK